MKFKDSEGNWQELWLKPNGDTLPIGSIQQFGGKNAPTNWLICDGSEISREKYKDLFDVIGTSYGEGNGDTTFNLPDLRGKIGVGLNSGDDDFNEMGKTGGEKTHKLTVDEMPSHTHSDHYLTGGGNYGVSLGSWDGTHYFIESPNTNATTNTGSTGGDQPHNNLQPYVVTNYIIKYGNAVGIVGTVSKDLSDINENAVPTCKTVNDYVNELINSEVVKIEESNETYLKRRSIKFANGFMINTADEYHADATSAAAGVYCGPEHQISWLTPFVEFYTVSCALGRSNRSGWASSYYANDTEPLTKTPKYRPMATTTGEFNYKISITAFGRWK